MKKILKITAVILFFVLFPAVSRAATLNLIVDKSAPIVGEEFTASIKINSEGVSINAAQATLKYSNSLLEVRRISKTGSIFGFWLIDPAVNQSGEISFVGGAASGFSGQSLQVLDVTFKVKGIGTANLTFTDSAVTASDGSGTNVLSASNGLALQILTKSAVVNPPLISREPTAASNAPAKPIVTVPLYPNPLNWNNLSSDFSASWNLPGDITGVATSLNKIPDSAPTISKGLFDNEVFKALPNGIWYLHVRFKNKIGWGATNHYRIAIDTVPPLPFKIEVSTGLSSDNPVPVFKYFSSDQFSGIDYYGIKIGNQAEVKTSKTAYTSSPLPPGTHEILITAHDRAGNAAEARISLEVIPIPSPQILFITKDVFVGEGGLLMSGTAVPGTAVLVNLKDSKGNSSHQTETTATPEGYWSLSIDIPLKKDVYTIEAVSRDSRGAQSWPAVADKINVKERPILTIGGIGITYPWFLAGLLAISAGAFLGGWFLRRAATSQRDRKILIAERDVNGVLSNIKADIESILEEHKLGVRLPESVETKVNFMLKKINDNITKNKSYILENIEEIE